ncbi:MAG: 16S rRNA methyltransferase [Anaerolineales bacterium]
MTALDDLLNAVQTSPKYQDITPQIIRRIGAQELRKHKRAKDAIKATKNKLHQISAAYMAGAFPYDVWREMLAAVHNLDDQRAICQDIMHSHASTRERLPLLETFYSTIFAETGPVSHIIDLACGLNPLAWPWMGLGPNVRYDAYDIPERMMAFLADALAQFGVKGDVAPRDVLTDVPATPADLALVLKTLPCLEQIDKHAPQTVLSALQTRYAVVSFPVRSLGGAQKGMASHYATHFEDTLESLPWAAQRLPIDQELVYLLTRRTG